MKKLMPVTCLACWSAQAMDYTAVFKAPPPSVPTPAMPGGPLLGNGDVE